MLLSLVLRLSLTCTAYTIHIEMKTGMRSRIHPCIPYYFLVLSLAHVVVKAFSRCTGVASGS